MDVYKVRIKPLFENAGKTDLELEKEIGLPRGSIYNWNSSKVSSYKKYVDKIASYFGVTTDYLLGNETPTSSKDEELARLLQNPGCRRVLEMFRKLSPENQDIALAHIEAMAKLLENKKD